MLKLVKINPWNYLVGKIFIWFWIVIFSVIAATTVVVHQLQPEPEYSPMNQRHLTHLTKKARFLANKTQWVSDPETTFKQPAFSRHRPFIVVSRDKHKTFSNVPLPRSINKRQIFRLANSAYPQVVHFGDLRIEGPVAFSVDAQEYHLFSLHLPRSRTPSARIRDLPIWLRIVLPLILSAILSYLLARSLANPILKLRGSTQELAKGNLDARCISVSARQDELGKLGQDFDSMAEKISALVSAQQRLLGDVSHELRSPLARLRLASGMLLDANDTGKERLLAQIERESERLDNMLSDVLRLSRLENQLKLPESQPIEINEFLRLLVGDLQIEAEADQKHIISKFDGHHTIQGNPPLLASALENVLRNAIKYTEPTTNVIVNLSRSDNTQGINITIEDFGTGIDTENVERIFEPFYRESTSRTRQTGGTGLGLAISKRAILQHGGQITAQNAPTHSGLIVTIFLPLSEAS